MPTKRLFLGIVSSLLASASFVGSAVAQPEKTDLKFGFIKLTDMAPLAIALEKGYFKDEGLNVTLEAQPNWRAVTLGVASGELDGSHMLPGQPLAATIGVKDTLEGMQPIVTTVSMDRNGNAITVSNDVWAKMVDKIERTKRGKIKHPISSKYLKPITDSAKASGSRLKMGMVYPVSTHNYELRYWLAAGGVNPGMYTLEDRTSNSGGHSGADVELYVTPPPKMPDTMQAGEIAGYAVGEPWNQQAVFAGIGVPVIANHYIWNNNPEKVFGMTEAFVNENPKTAVAITKAIIRAGKWLDDGGTFNRPEAISILAQPNYVGADYNVLANSMTGTFEYEPGDLRIEPEFNTFFADFATYPFYSDAVWFLTQMRRWGQITEAMPNEWYHDIAKRVYRTDIYMEAAKELIAEGHVTEDEVPLGTDGYRAPTNAFIDGIEYNGKDPLGYLASLPMGNTN